MSHLSSTNALKACSGQSLSVHFNSHKRTALYVLLQLLGYERRVQKFSLPRDKYLKEKKKEISQAKGKVLERVQCSEHLKMTGWRVCVYISIFRFKGSECEDEIVV